MCNFTYVLTWPDCPQVDVEASEAVVVVTGVAEAVVVAVVTSNPSKGLTPALPLAAKSHLTRYIAQALSERNAGHSSGHALSVVLLKPNKSYVYMQRTEMQVQKTEYISGSNNRLESFHYLKSCLCFVSTVDVYSSFLILVSLVLFFSSLVPMYLCRGPAGYEFTAGGCLPNHLLNFETWCSFCCCKLNI